MSSRVASRVALVILMAAAFCTVTSTARAEIPGHNGKLTFMRADDSGLWQVWVANADLSCQTQLTRGDRDNGWPVWAPRGREIIAFQSDRNDPDLGDDAFIFDILVMRSDGTGVTQLTDGSGYAADPAWSPNGRRIAFDDDFGIPADQGIFTMQSDGSDLRRVTSLTPNGEFDAAPRYSPDGKRLVFTRVTLDGDTEHAALYVVDVDGTNLHRVTPFTLGAGDADWSPSGDSLVFEADSDKGFHGDVFTVRANGSRLRNITRNDGFTAGSADPVWSPDGSMILFDSGVFAQGSFVYEGLATMRPDGRDRKFVSFPPDGEHQPDWQSVPYHSRDRSR